MKERIHLKLRQLKEVYRTHLSQELYQQRSLKTQQNAHKTTLKMNFPETSSPKNVD